MMRQFGVEGMRSWLAVGLMVANMLNAGPASAIECKGSDEFQCLADHAKAELDRLDLNPNEDQASSFKALSAFSTFLDDGPAATTKDWEEKKLPVYDLILTLLLANRDADAREVALAASQSFASDADGKALKGEEGFAQMREDLKSFYHGEEDMTYARACVSDEAFKDLIGGGPKMRRGACRLPYDTRSIQQAFGMMQFLKGVTQDQAVEAAMQYAYRVPSCKVATAIIEVAPTATALGEDKTSAAWKVLDMATVCAAELLAPREL